MCKKLIFLLSFLVMLSMLSGLVTAEEIWREAELADTLTSPYLIYDDAEASGGQYINAAPGTEWSTDNSPAPDGTASFTFDAPAGTYKVAIRVKIIEGVNDYDNDSLWVCMDSGTLVKFNGITHAGNVWHWDTVHDADSSNAIVEFTLADGQHVLEVSYRETECLVDAVLITDDPALDDTTLPDQIPGGADLYGPINRYSFNDGDTTAVDSVGGKDGTLEGTASIAGNRLVLDGSGASYLPSDVLDPGLESVTIEAWVEVGTASTWARAFDFGESSGSDGGNTMYFVPNSGSNNTQLTVSTTGFPSWQTGEESVTSDGLVEGVMTHVACVYDGSMPEIRLYMDGELKASGATTMDLSLVGRMNAYIGDSSYSGDPGFNGSVDEFRIYDTALVDDEVLASFNAGPDAEFGGPPPAIVKATKPDPANGTEDLPRRAMLSWTPGDYADLHDVYFSTSMQEVTDGNATALISAGQVDAFYDTGHLDYGMTYYWRIDEVNAVDMAVYPGNVWSFSTQPIGLIMPGSAIIANASSQQSDDQGPENTINDSGLNADNQHSTDGLTMWYSASTTEPNKAWIKYDFDKVYKLPQMLVWNYNAPGFFSGAGLKEIVIEYSTDSGATWAPLNGAIELPQASGTEDYAPEIIDLGGVADGIAANSIRITANSNWSDGVLPVYGLSEVKFYYIPVWPTEPVPADDAMDVEIITTLSWTPGDGSVEHVVYLGTDEQAVTDGTADAYMLSDPSLDVELILGTAYFWRIEEVNMASEPNTWSGDTLSFTTSDYRVVDDFESYGSSVRNWSGGSSSTGNGAAIGPVETSIVKSGVQSMQLLFDNTSTQGYSEISVNPGSLACGNNWLTGGPTSLVFWVYGDIDNVDTEYLYVRINGAIYRRLVPVTELVTPWWTQVTIPFNHTHAKFNNINSLQIGFMRDDFDTGTGVVYVDDIRLYRVTPVPVEPANPGDANLVAEYSMENNVDDSSGSGINGIALGEPNYVAGPYGNFGQALEFDANDDVVDLGPADPFNFTGSFSISLWANIQNWGNEWGHAMVAARGEGTEGFQLRRGGGWVGGMQGKPSTGLCFTTRGIGLSEYGAGNEDMMVDPPKQGVWTNITCVVDLENNVKSVYYDGELIQASPTVPDSVLSPASQNASLGARANGDNTGFEALFNGLLDDVKIYDKALTAEEAKFLADPTP